MNRIKLNILAVCLLATFGLTGCGFQPLHGTTASGELMRNQLSSVHVPLINGRVGQQVRNEILYHFTGGDYADGKKYVLNIAVKKSVTGLLLRRTGDAYSKSYRLDATFTLSKVGKKEKEIFKSTSTASASFNTIFEYRRDEVLDANGNPVPTNTLVTSTYAHIRAERNAGNRAAKALAFDIKTRVASFLSANS